MSQQIDEGSPRAKILKADRRSSAPSILLWDETIYQSIIEGSSDAGGGTEEIKSNLNLETAEATDQIEILKRRASFANSRRGSWPQRRESKVYTAPDPDIADNEIKNNHVWPENKETKQSYYPRELVNIFSPTQVSAVGAQRDFVAETWRKQELNYYNVDHAESKVNVSPISPPTVQTTNLIKSTCTPLDLAQKQVQLQQQISQQLLTVQRQLAEQQIATAASATAVSSSSSSL